MNLYYYGEDNAVTAADPAGLTPHPAPGCKEAAAIRQGIKAACAAAAAHKKCLGAFCWQKMKKLCNHDFPISCGSPDCNAENKNVAKGCTGGYTTNGGKGAIVICVGAIDTKGCQNDYGVPDAGDLIADTILHEMLHKACGTLDHVGGVPPGDYNKHPNPTEATARCCLGLKGGTSGYAN